MTLPEHYRESVARKQAEVTRALHHTAWADLWAQGVPFFSAELAFHWRELRREVVGFWEPMGAADMIHGLRLDMDELVRQDEALETAYKHRQASYATHLCFDTDQDGICQGACDWGEA